MARKLIKCKHCGAEIAKSAKTCPHCGGKNVNTFATVLGCLAIIFLAFVLIVAILGNSSEEPALEKTIFGVGERAELNNIAVTLVDVSTNTGGNYMTPEQGKEFVTCEFEIENNSGKTIGVSSLISFAAYFDEYSTPMSLTAMLSTNQQQLDGEIANGKKMNGVIGYEVSPEWKKVEIHFAADFWQGREFKFIASND